jgi:RNA polymerase-interacting CarD/CdnL/TRCF family regulator
MQQEKKEKATYSVGQSVLHPKFGIGKVQKINQQFIDIDFDGIGIKTLLVEIAPLKVIK